MRETVYVEKNVENHPRVKKFLSRLRNPRIVLCTQYKEIFNRKNQSFRVQKQNPAWIIAEKQGELVHTIPEKFGIGGEKNYYFSHVLNCPYDCKYCFLQGMFSSAYYVFFINFEQIQEAILDKGPAHFFSGYDGDSLALEHKTHFIQEFLPFFAQHPDYLLEIRTKSAYIAPFLQQPAQANVVVAWSLNPENIVRCLEKKTAPLEKRLDAIVDLQNRGWKIGLRFDPIVVQENFSFHMEKFFSYVFSKVDATNLHSVTLGAFRFPKSFRKLMEKNVDDPRFFAHSHLVKKEFRYQEEKKMIETCKTQLAKYLPENILFSI